MKTCTMCGSSKRLADFYRDKSRADGFGHRCKVCDKAKAWQWQIDNPEKVSATKSAWRSENAEHHRASKQARHARRRIEGRVAVREKNRRRRSAMQSGLTAMDKSASIEYRRAILNDPCAYCGEVRDVMHTDHFFPIALGGTDMWSNLVRACQSCNATKGVRCGIWMKLRSQQAGLPGKSRMATMLSS